MAKEITPAWQQVLLIALNNVPKAKNGHEAWNKLNTDEQSAVMDFLTEHCGENAQAALEGTCGEIKHPRWWVTFWLSFCSIIAIIAGVFLLMRLQDALQVRVAPFIWLALCPLNMHTAWKGNPTGKMLEIWKAHVENHEGTLAALNSMHHACTAPRKERMQKGNFIFYAVMLVLWLFLAGVEVAEYRGPSVPQQVVSVLEDAADGKADLDAALQLFEPLEYGQAKEALQSAWDKTAKWSDERYLTAALAVHLGLETAPDYAREALLTTRLGALDTPAESAEFAALLALCDAETVQSVRQRVEAAEFPQKEAVLQALDAAMD